nr:MAG TPA: hypothetical protein [Caudoviricetes sp.]
MFISGLHEIYMGGLVSGVTTWIGGADCFFISIYKILFMILFHIIIIWYICRCKI